MHIPAISPQAYEASGFSVSWYAIFYVLGLVSSWLVLKILALRRDSILSPGDVEYLMFWISVGAVCGGRLGYVMLYFPVFYLSNPFQVIALWNGGMSFFGGLIGVSICTFICCRIQGWRVAAVADTIAIATPIAITFGRIGNIINNELIGRQTGSSWGVIYDAVDNTPRYPSQFFELLIEGVCAAIIMAYMKYASRRLYASGTFAVVLLLFYSVGRFICEFFREPDEGALLNFGPLTEGQILSLVMFAAIFMRFRSGSIWAVPSQR